MSDLNFAENLVLRGMKSFTKPKKDFDPATAPKAPDYSLADWWAATPNAPGKSEFVPMGHKPTALEDRVFDVFYIHPTSNFSANYWNAPLSLAKATELVNEINLTGQASAFNEACKIYAPRYRQASFYAFLENDEQTHGALSLAYSDIREAFLYYLDHYNEGRPYFIAGHSQGCLHGIRLLEDVVEHHESRERMVAAYLLGFQFPKVKFGTTLHHIKPAQGRYDTGCVIAWDTYGDSGGPLHDVDKCAHFYPDTQTWQRRSRKPVYSINPLSWRTDRDLVPSSYHLGGCRAKFKIDNFSWKALYADEAMGLDTRGLSRPYPGEVSTQIDDQGILKISKPKHKAFNFGVMPGENYHIFDFALFYMDIRHNVSERAAAYQLARRLN